ncbi:MAG: STAS domain-containing protein [Ilumatobacteraceae bacterium]
MAELGTTLEITPSDEGFILVGEVDAHTAPQLKEAVAGREASVVVLDISGVTFMDSSGLRVVITATEDARASGGDLVLAHPSAAVARLLEISGLTEHLTLR